MKRAIYITISLALVISVFISELLGEGKPFYQMSNPEIDSLLTIVSTQNLTITDRINLFSDKFLGMPYNQNCAGDGPYALYESWPLVNFKETNCMVFCEHVLALSISDSWDNFFNNLQQQLMVLTNIIILLSHLNRASPDPVEGSSELVEGSAKP